MIESTLMIEGTGQTLARGVNSPLRFFCVIGTGRLSLTDLTMANGRAAGGNGGSGYGGGGGGAGLGGAILVLPESSLDAFRCTFKGNLAEGGDGGNAASGVGLGGGGGGGEFGNGENRSGSSGGFGGELFGGSGGSAGEDAPLPGSTFGADLFGGGGGSGSATAGNPEPRGGRGSLFGGGGGGLDSSSGSAVRFAGGGGYEDTRGGGGGAGVGGAIANIAGTVNVTNCTFTGNIARGGDGSLFGAGGSAPQCGFGVGGALANVSGTMTVTHCTVAYNAVQAGVTNNDVQIELQEAGGIANISASGLDLTNQATLTLRNTIVAAYGPYGNVGNVALNGGAATITATAPNLLSSAVTSSGAGTVNNTSGVVVADPLLGNLARNGGFTETIEIKRNSPALNKVTVFVLVDQRGVGRNTGTPDLGAYEVNGPLKPVGVPVLATQLYSPLPSANANEAFVKGVYQSTLLRSPAASEVSFWVGQISVGQTRNQVAFNFVNSTENRTNQVTYL